MRRVFYVLLALIYATLSTGAPALVHFCAHEEVFHLATGNHEHEQIDCCHSAESLASSTCHESPTSAQTAAPDDDCCVSSSVAIDSGKQERSDDASLALFVAQRRILATDLVQIKSTSACVSSSNKRGPPIYILLQRLVLYA